MGCLQSFLEAAFRHEGLEIARQDPDILYLSLAQFRTLLVQLRFPDARTGHARLTNTDIPVTIRAEFLEGRLQKLLARRVFQVRLYLRQSFLL